MIASTVTRCRTRDRSGVLILIVMVALLVLFLLGFALAAQTGGVRTDSQILFCRLLALNGARNAVQETIPAFVTRVNTHAMRIRIPAGQKTGSDAAEARLNGVAGSSEQAYKRFMEQFDGMQKYSMETLSGEGERPPCTLVDLPEGMVLELPADPLYIALRQDPARFKATMPPTLSNRIYASYGNRARLEPMEVEVHWTGDDDSKPGRLQGVFAFTAECAMTSGKLTVRRRLQLRRRFRLTPAKGPAGHSVVELDEAVLGEVLLPPRAGEKET